MNATLEIELPQTGEGPLYARLRRAILDGIRNDVFGPGHALPSERMLGEQFGLSRVTVRKAIDGLVAEGLIERRRGSGMFVVPPPMEEPAKRVEKSFSVLSSFSEDMVARGRTPSSRWVSRTSGPVTAEEALAFGLSPGTPVHRLTRIRMADGVPMALEQSTIAGFALSSTDAVADSLYAALEKEGFRPVRALQRLRAELAGPYHGEMLEIDGGEAGLAIERRGFCADGRPVEITNSFYRGDAYDMVAELSL